MDLYNSLPFYSETEEIVRHITLNTNGPASAQGKDITIAKLIYNNPESVTAYHKDRPCKYLGIRDDSSSYQTKFSYGIDDVVIVQLGVAKSNGELSGDISAYFSELDYVNFVDIEVPDTVEVVKKLDPKFVDGGVVVLTEDDTKYTCNYSASELIKMYVENPGQLGTAKFVRRDDEYNLYVSYLKGVNCDPNGDSLVLLFNDMSIKVTPDSVSPIEDE